MELKKRSVVFNVAEEDQERLYKHSLLYTNFSAYIKLLIKKDMEEMEREFDSK